MAKAPTMKEVAKAAGVSVMTVSRAFRADASISTATREKIQRAADELGYVFDATASGLRVKKSGFVAMTIPSISNSNFADTVGGLSERLAASGRQVLLGYTNYDIDEEERLIRQLLGRRPEAIVVTGGQHTEAARKLLQGSGIPVVETWDLPTDPIGSVIGFSNAKAMEAMVQHLVDAGHRRIAYLGGDGNADTRGADRRRGFVDAMAHHGLAADLLIDAGLPPISMREGAHAMGALLDSGRTVDAVCCVSDLAAFGALTECQRRGLKVPDDISIAGFGAYELGDICVPTITTIDPAAREIGARAADLLIKCLDDGQSELIAAPITPKLLIRQSSDAAKGGQKK